MIGLLGLATYIFTAVFVYMSEKDLEHYVTDTTEKSDIAAGTCVRQSTSHSLPPAIVRTSSSTEENMTYEQSCNDGFVEIDLEHQGRMETITITERLEPKDRKKTRLTLFN